MYEDIITDMQNKIVNRRTAFQKSADIFTLEMHDIYSFARYFKLTDNYIELIDGKSNGVTERAGVKSIDYSALQHFLIHYSKFENRLKNALNEKLFFTKQTLSGYLRVLHYLEYNLANGYRDGVIHPDNIYMDASSICLMYEFKDNLNELEFEDIFEFVKSKVKIDITNWFTKHKLNVPCMLTTTDNGELKFIYATGSMYIKYTDAEMIITCTSHNDLHSSEIINWIPGFAEDIYLTIQLFIHQFTHMEMMDV